MFYRSCVTRVDEALCQQRPPTHIQPAVTSSVGSYRALFRRKDRAVGTLRPRGSGRTRDAAKDRPCHRPRPGRGTRGLPVPRPRRVIHEGPGRPRTARASGRIATSCRKRQSASGGIVPRRDRAGERRRSPRVGEAVTDDAPAHHQDSAACAEEGDLLAEHLDPFVRQGMDPMLDGADGFGVVDEGVAPDSGPR